MRKMMDQLRRHYDESEIYQPSPFYCFSPSSSISPSPVHTPQSSSSSYLIDPFSYLLSLPEPSSLSLLSPQHEASSPSSSSFHSRVNRTTQKRQKDHPSILPDRTGECPQETDVFSLSRTRHLPSSCSSTRPSSSCSSAISPPSSSSFRDNLSEKSSSFAFSPNSPLFLQPSSLIFDDVFPRDTSSRSKESYLDDKKTESKRSFLTCSSSPPLSIERRKLHEKEGDVKGIENNEEEKTKKRNTKAGEEAASQAEGRKNSSLPSIASSASRQSPIERRKGKKVDGDTSNKKKENKEKSRQRWAEREAIALSKKRLEVYRQRVARAEAKAAALEKEKKKRLLEEAEARMQEEKERERRRREQEEQEARELMELQKQLAAQ
ncbi:hypothetical protein CSUI_010461, partial [Cystoisospora suis]